MSKKFRDYFEQQMADPEFRLEWDTAWPKTQFVQQLLAVMERKGISQGDLARRLKVERSTISRALDLDTPAITTRTMGRLANAVGYEVIVGIRPRTKRGVSIARGAKS